MFLLCEGIMALFFVVASSLNQYDTATLRSFHATEQAAIVAMDKTIDSKKLYIVLARVQLAENGNVRYWESVK
jgi:hypothetical protein